MREPGRRSTVRRGALPLRMILTLGVAAILIVSGFVLLRKEPETHTVSHVARLVREIALSTNAPDAPRGAGTLGPWKIAAQNVDPVDGDLINFQLTSRELMLGAERAKLIIDPETDTLTLELRQVVFARVPEEMKNDTEAFLHAREEYRLGPIPYGIDIVPDGSQ